MKNLSVIALGGNAIQKMDGKQVLLKECRVVREVIREIKDFLKKPLIITHGNGPHVGKILEKKEIPIYLATAQTQFEIGTLIEQAVKDVLREMGLNRPVATVASRVLVDIKDKAFRNPVKMIGRFYQRAQVEELEKQGFIMKEDVSGKGWRRVVASPEPLEILEIGAIRNLLENNAIVIAVGGGGIPVYRAPAGLCGVEAVIDKDRASQLVATGLGAERLIILTNIEQAAINFKKADEEFLNKITYKELEHHYLGGHFAAGSMGPKIEAVIRFMKSGGKKAIIAHAFKFQKGKRTEIVS